MLAIPERLTLRGAPATIDAIATNPAIAGAVLAGGGDCLLALKRNQPTLHDGVAACFEDPATTGLASITVTDKDHGRIEPRTIPVSLEAGWLTGDRRHPGEHPFPGLTSLVRSTTEVGRMGKIPRETRYVISSAALVPERAAQASACRSGLGRRAIAVPPLGQAHAAATGAPAPVVPAQPGLSCAGPPVLVSDTFPARIPGESGSCGAPAGRIRPQTGDHACPGRMSASRR